MVGHKLREALGREGVENDKLARDVIALSSDAALKDLQDGFRVVLGTGCLDENRAQYLLEALRILAGLQAEFRAPEIIALRREVEILDKRRRELKPEQKQIGALAAREKELQEKIDGLKERLVQLQTECDRLEVIKGDFK